MRYMCSVLCCSVALCCGHGLTCVWSVCVELSCLVRCVLWWLRSVWTVHALRVSGGWVHVLCVVL